MTEDENEQRFADCTLYRAAAGAAERARYTETTVGSGECVKCEVMEFESDGSLLW